MAVKSKGVPGSNRAVCMASTALFVGSTACIVKMNIAGVELKIRAKIHGKILRGILRGVNERNLVPFSREVHHH